MRPHRATVLLTAGLVTLLGTPAVAAAGTPADLYVNSDTTCSDTGPGSKALPFCLLSSAARIVKPGQTVRMKARAHSAESLVIDRSGEPGKPITFVVETTSPLFPKAFLDGDLTVKGASHVRISGLGVGGTARVSRSADIELNAITSVRRDADALVVGDASKDVRVTRSQLTAVRIEGGAERTLFSRNLNYGRPRAALTVVDAPGTVITNNTVYGACVTPLSMSGGSSGSAVFNNVIYAEPSADCPDAGLRKGINVSASAAVGTRADYNLIVGDPAVTLMAYKWAGASYRKPAEFAAATGQGAHDIFRATSTGVGFNVAGSPTIDSADATAPGALVPDYSGLPALDDQRVPNTGKNGGYLDRGAVETSIGVTTVK
ncbi:hypothetical protein [Streptomyces sp. NBC_00096]|uniref:hypothetical protein n=1 Tax=Streptomyces sp. NBC_00096 TaxID=2975650 RepID=UPI003245264F